MDPTTATTGPTPHSPPHDPLDFVPVGSPDEEIPSPPSEEDHDLDHDQGHDDGHEHRQDQDQDQNLEIPSATGVLTDDLKNKIIKQVRA